jgi:peptidyl-prolyl cis-trans isomerase A (cyclophilin A)
MFTTPRTLHNPLRRLTLLVAATSAALALAAPAAFAQTATAAKAASPQVKITTSMGDITLELYPDKAPKTVENFLQYVKDKHYDNTIFHRVMDGFMIQGGGFNADMAQKPTRAPIILESQNGLKNDRGTVAMARTQVPDSASAQFFINLVNNDNLNFPAPDGYGYAVFGKVIAGMDVVDKIRKVEVGNRGPHANVPVSTVTIKNAVPIKK